MKKMDFKVKGMHCNACKILVSEALQEAGAREINVKVDEKLSLGFVSVKTDLDEKKIKEIITSQGSYSIIEGK